MDASHKDGPNDRPPPGLRYVSDEEPGFRRRRQGRGFTYLDERGSRVRDAEHLARIRGLAIPPAWTDVWICADPRGHLQATGRDARGRKQYRYHPRWREHRDAAKFDRMLDFGRRLPAIRRRVSEDLSAPGLPRPKVLAAVTTLLDTTLLRIGNDPYARENGSYGLTTLRDRHVEVEGSRIRIRFRGKGRRMHEADLRDRRLARVVRRCQDLPGQRLFQYVDEEGEVREVSSDDVNQYLREASGAEATAKEFRTWAGTVLAVCALAEAGPASTKREATRNVTEAVSRVSQILGNTPAVCRASYIHPIVLESYLDGSFPERLRVPAPVAAEHLEDLKAVERRVLRLLRQLSREDRPMVRAASNGRR